MKKCSFIALFLVLFLSSTVMAGARSEEKSTTDRLVKAVRMIHFSSWTGSIPDDLSRVRKEAEKWLSRKDADTILSYSETAACQTFNCAAYATILYWEMVPEE